MTTTFMTNVPINAFGPSFLDIMMDLKRKHNHTDLNSIHSEIIKTIDFKEYLQ